MLDREVPSAKCGYILPASFVIMETFQNSRRKQKCERVLRTCTDRRGMPDGRGIFPPAAPYKERGADVQFSASTGNGTQRAVSDADPPRRRAAPIGTGSKFQAPRCPTQDNAGPFSMLKQFCRGSVYRPVICRDGRRNNRWVSRAVPAPQRRNKIEKNGGTDSFVPPHGGCCRSIISS